MKNYASSMITDMVNPDNEMFHSDGNPPIYVKITTSTDPSEITRLSAFRIFAHHKTDSILTKEMGEVLINKNILIVRLAYEDMPDRTMSFNLSLSDATLVLS
jgi:hypothetical protein